MKDDSFILMSLKDGKSKKLAQVMTNDSSRKILDFLGRKEEATESMIAKELDLPISTVHYNMKLLVDAGFLTADEYTYSEKGKEVTHYRLANKLIVIAPKTTFGFKQKLRSILPVGIVGAGIAVLIKLFPFLNPYSAAESAPQFAMHKTAADGASGVVRDTAVAPAAEPLIDGIAENAVDSVADEAVETVSSTAAESVSSTAVNEVADTVAGEGARALAETQEITRAPVDIAVQKSSYALYSDIAIWFFFGVLTTIALILLIDWARSKR